MLKLIKRIEDIGEYLRANIRYDLSTKIDYFDFFKNRNQKDILLKQKIDKNLNRQITADDKL